MSKVSKQLSWLLRHGAKEVKLKVDEAGFVAIKDVLCYLSIVNQELLDIVATDNKSRFEIKGDKIRACQGHSMLDAEALEKTWEEYTADAPVWHGTSFNVVGQILKQGLLPGTRSHVHLAEELDSTVGKRANVAVMLKVDPIKVREHGIKLFKSPNGVILARTIPADCIVEVVPITRKARQNLA